MESLEIKKRTPRTSLAEERAARVTERDTWILEALAKMRFLTTRQLARLFFQGSKWSANKRLRKLFDAGLVKVWLRSLSEENVYSLTQKGRGLISQEVLKAGAQVPRGLDGNLEHLLAINQVRISMALGLPKIGGEIAWWRSDWELRAQGKARTIPDALFEVRWGTGEARIFALELDNNTKSQRGFLKKILGYLSVHGRSESLYGVRDFITLVVGSDAAWVEKYREALAGSDLVTRIWFTTMEKLEERGVESEIWKAPGTEENYSLQKIGSLPYGKEGSTAEMGCFT